MVYDKDGNMKGIMSPTHHDFVEETMDKYYGQNTRRRLRKLNGDEENENGNMADPCVGIGGLVLDEFGRPVIKSNTY